MRKTIKLTASFTLAILLFCLCAIPVMAAVPTVTNSNADIDGTTVTLYGNITATGVGGDDDERGFVWDDATTHADPGNVAPNISGYNNNWTESGSFGTGAFSHEVTGLTALVTYYYRACAHSVDGWAYSDEITFFTFVDNHVYLEFRPDLNETRIRGNAGIPTDALVGIFHGYSLPIWNEDDEELYFLHCVPDRWDSSSDPATGRHIIVHIISSLANANESGNSYQLELAYEHVTPNEEEVPITTHTTTAIRTIYSNTQYECYRDYFVVLYNCDVGDDITADDLLALRVRRIAAGGQLKELDGELIIHAVDVLYARGDFLKDPLSFILIWIEEGIIVGGEDVFFLALILLVLGMTIATFALASGRRILAFASAGAWMILGVYSYTQFVDLWDVYYAMFWLSMGMVFVCVLIPAILREKADALEGAEEDENPEDEALLADLDADKKDRERQDKLFSRPKRQRTRRKY